MYSGLPSGLLRVERIPAAKRKEPSDIANYMAKHSEFYICVRRNFVCLCARMCAFLCVSVRVCMLNYLNTNFAQKEDFLPNLRTECLFNYITK